MISGMVFSWKIRQSEVRERNHTSGTTSACHSVASPRVAMPRVRRRKRPCTGVRSIPVGPPSDSPGRPIQSVTAVPSKAFTSPGLDSVAKRIRKT